MAKVAKKSGSTKKSQGVQEAQGVSSLLCVIDRLEVGPVKVESQRLSMPYRVFYNGREEGTDLIYRYDEPVFDPSEPDSRNLAAMIGVQVAINYGLFCHTIVFHDRLDEADQRFIKDMMENTAREIFVKKFLEPNAFLTGLPLPLAPEKKSRYLQAELEFPGKISKRGRAAFTPWQGQKERCAVLSSGGKDSLLSFAVLNEIGQEVHPVFVNESGRHWYTALNAHRYFKEKIPRTAKVWTNADRVFLWMLRHFPFIRKDFVNVRSDQYPIRLWTVAVFSFGVLPILRKRGVGRLVVGDEFDTTRRTACKGIKHYDGLYDQSRYFDDALSRYFLQKKWGLSQFSVLRPLSELLVQKILVERYPGLQEHQVSCHAAHTEGGRVRPCGKCEKCRRVVGMLMALEANPENCGYTPKQIDFSLNSIPQKGVSQESHGVQQLKYMLHRRGLLKSGHPEIRAQSLKGRPEVLKLRFDPERSPMDAIPVDYRKPLYQIYLKYSGGVTRRMGRIWIDFDFLTDPLLLQPYSFEKAHARNPKLSGGKKGDKKVRNHILGELTWPEAELRFQEVDIALLPVGAIEQHGPHLPLDTDAFDAEYLAHEVASACGDPKPLVLPLVPYGVSYHHDEFKGTISIGNNTLSQLIYEIGKSAARNGITKLVIINGHGGNTPALDFAAQMINRDSHIFVCVENGETSDVDIDALIDTPNDVHAGEIETSTCLAIRPRLVKMDKAKKFVPEFSSRYLNFTSKRGVSWYAYTKRISENGVMGDPTKASAAKGKKIWKIMIAHLVEFVEDLKGMTLEEIYQRRY